MARCSECPAVFSNESRCFVCGSQMDRLIPTPHPSGMHWSPAPKRVEGWTVPAWDGTYPL